jgi:hypothetical protein
MRENKVRITVELTPAQHERITNAAETTGITIATKMRELTLIWAKEVGA